MRFAACCASCVASGAHGGGACPSEHLIHILDRRIVQVGISGPADTNLGAGGGAFAFDPARCCHEEAAIALERLPPSELLPDIVMRTSLDDVNPHPNPLDRYVAFYPFF